MLPDDDEPQHKKPQSKNLDILSIEALNEYIVDLQNEIQRAQEAINKKQSSRAAADSFFKS